MSDASNADSYSGTSRAIGCTISRCISAESWIKLQRKTHAITARCSRASMPLIPRDTSILWNIWNKCVHFNISYDNSLAINKMEINNNVTLFFQHYLKVHAEKNYVCDRCGKSFSTESAKKGHIRVCGVEFTCSCSKTYITYEALLTHAKRSLHTITEKYKNSRYLFIPHIFSNYCHTNWNWIEYLLIYL